MFPETINPYSLEPSDNLLQRPPNPQRHRISEKWTDSLGSSGINSSEDRVHDQIALRGWSWTHTDCLVRHPHMKLRTGREKGELFYTVHTVYFCMCYNISIKIRGKPTAVYSLCVSVTVNGDGLYSHLLARPHDLK